jgi:hypothetical protein
MLLAATRRRAPILQQALRAQEVQDRKHTPVVTVGLPEVSTAAAEITARAQ